MIIREIEVDQTCSKCGKEYLEQSIDYRCGTCGGTGDIDGAKCFQCKGDGEISYTPKICIDCYHDEIEDDDW